MKAKDGSENIIDTSKPRNEENGEAKLYKICVNGVNIDVDAATMQFAKTRAQKYLLLLKKESAEQTGSLRSFWADIIMLNILTNGILRDTSPYTIEQALYPVKYFTKEKAKEFYDEVQKIIEEQRRSEQESVVPEDS